MWRCTTEPRGASAFHSFGPSIVLVLPYGLITSWHLQYSWLHLRYSWPRLWYFHLHSFIHCLPLISPSRSMFSVLCLTMYVLCFTASLGTSGTFTSELRSVLVYIARLVLVNYSVRKLTLHAPQPRLPSDSSASATFTSLTSVLLDFRSPRPPISSTSVPLDLRLRTSSRTRQHVTLPPCGVRDSLRSPSSPRLTYLNLRGIPARS